MRVARACGPSTQGRTARDRGLEWESGRDFAASRRDRSATSGATPLGKGKVLAQGCSTPRGRAPSPEGGPAACLGERGRWAASCDHGRATRARRTTRKGVEGLGEELVSSSIGEQPRELRARRRISPGGRKIRLFVAKKNGSGARRGERRERRSPADEGLQFVVQSDMLWVVDRCESLDLVWLRGHWVVSRNPEI